jgi:hypothetical protein
MCSPLVTTCGNGGQMCCLSTGVPCYYTGCRNRVCEACGAGFQPCCLFGRAPCDAGLACNPIGYCR